MIPLLFALAAHASPAPTTVWTPTDLAAKSGPGLRGAVVTDVQATPRAVLVATRGGGLATWDGNAWQHGPSTGPVAWPTSVALADETVWIGTHDGLWTAPLSDSLEPKRMPHTPDEAVWDVVADSGTVWFRTDTGIHQLRDRQSELLVRDTECTRLIATHPGALALCSTPRRLPSGLVPAWLPKDVDATDLVRRDDGGAWIATSWEGLLIHANGQTLPWWRPERGEVARIVRLEDHLLAAAGRDGLWRITGAGPAPIARSQGVPGRYVSRVATAPDAHIAWVGTDRGVAAVDRSGHATPLPLSTLPAGATVTAIVPVRGGAGVASALGLRWLGRRPPAGWRAFAVAVGPHPRGLLRHDDTWWAATTTALITLKDGELARWPLHAAVDHAIAAGRGVAVATADGLRTWVPGARMLSNAAPFPDADRIASTADGSIWALDGESVVRWDGGDTLRWGPLLGAHGVSADPGGAWIAAESGLFRVSTLSEDPAPIWPADETGPLSAVASADGLLWVAGRDGRIWRFDGRMTQVASLFDDGPTGEVLSIAPDPYGAWIATAHGAYRVLHGVSERRLRKLAREAVVSGR